MHDSISPDHCVAHQHLHHAATVTFEELWASLRLRALFRPSEVERSIRQEQALCPGLHTSPCLRGRKEEERLGKKKPLESAKHMAQWSDLLQQGFVARSLLEQHVQHGTVLKHCTDPACAYGRTIVKALMGGRSRRYMHGGYRYPWPKVVAKLGRRYRQAERGWPSSRSQKHRRSLVRDLADEEGRILARAFEYLRPDKADYDRDYETVFLQYLRVKAALYGLLVHPPGESGLQSFLDHFSQIKVYEPKSNMLRPAEPDEPGLEVISTEYRIAPDAWLDTISGGKERIEQVADETGRREAAWIIHFKRRRPDKLSPLHRRSMEAIDLESRKIANRLVQEPRRLYALRGIDICGVEEEQPLWVAAESLRVLRRRSSEIAGCRPELGLQPLRLTLHAGEEFRWLTSGVRAVSEPFQWELIERGDRIGHGIAVTLDPKGWWKRYAGQVIEVTRVDRLLDLAFLAAYTEAPGPVGRRQTGGVEVHQYVSNRTVQEQQWLQAEIKRTTQELGFLAVSGEENQIDIIEAAVEFWTRIGGRTARRLIRSSTKPREDAEPHEQWLFRYLCIGRTRKLADAIVSLPVEADGHYEGDLLIKARARLIREMAHWQVPIESNPSSNLVVASLDAIASQDFLAQSAQRPRQGQGKQTLTWTISTDDPITFSTSLADEYAYAWAGMVLREGKPYDPSHARALLDEAAATSVRTRFTVPDHDKQYSADNSCRR